MKDRKAKIFLIAVLLTCSYWLVGFSVHNIYKYVLLGAILELLWLPMVIAVFALPAATIYFWAKEKFSFRSLYLYAFLLFAVTFGVCFSLY